MDATAEILRVLDDVLGLGGRADRFTRETLLLGAIPELDSIAVVSLMTRIEQHFGIVIEDDEVDGNTFASVGSLVDFISGKLAT